MAGTKPGPDPYAHHAHARSRASLDYPLLRVDKQPGMARNVDELAAAYCTEGGGSGSRHTISSWECNALGDGGDANFWTTHSEVQNTALPLRRGVCRTNPQQRKRSLTAEPERYGGSPHSRMALRTNLIISHTGCIALAQSPAAVHRSNPT